MWIRLKKESTTDVQWSRNLQIIQSKIAVFEDLSDRTETQVKQLTTMMENKIFDLQKKIDEADDVLNKISNSMKKSMEVAQMFQDKIPHEEIIERQNTLKFVKAALMANEGSSIEEIKSLIDLPTSQIEFIVKVNAEKLSFDPNQVPEWIQREMNKDLSPKNKNLSKNMKSSLRPLDQILNHSFNLSQKLNATSKGLEESLVTPNTMSQIQVSSSIVASVPQNIYHNTRLENSALKGAIPSDANQKGVLVKNFNVRPVVFPRIEKN